MQEKNPLISLSFFLKGSDHYEVEKITGKKRKNGQIYYRVQWKGYTTQNWVKKRDCNCNCLIREFEASLHQTLSGRVEKRHRKRSGKNLSSLPPSQTPSDFFSMSNASLIPSVQEDNFLNFIEHHLTLEDVERLLLTSFDELFEVLEG